MHMQVIMYLFENFSKCLQLSLSAAEAASNRSSIRTTSVGVTCNIWPLLAVPASSLFVECKMISPSCHFGIALGLTLSAEASEPNILRQCLEKNRGSGARASALHTEGPGSRFQVGLEETPT